jgi:5-methyltetrahydrofolate--homocysteine methyltransferase
MPAVLDDIKQAVIDGNANASKDLTNKALSGGASALDIFQEALIPAMDEVGRRMQAEEYYIPEVLLSARAMRASSDVLKPLVMNNPDMKRAGKVVIGTVRGDLHDIGKNLVAMMLEGASFEINDLGINVTPEAFVAKIKEINPDLIALSAMLTTTMMGMKETIEAMKAAGVRSSVKVIVGGAPVNQRFADEIGADGYAADAATATNLAKKLVGA